jgi:peptide/nickel transport system substrate-binding protein
MGIRGPQGRHSRAALTTAVALVALAALAACESPPRSKPWRHEPDPTKVAEAAPRSPALAPDTADAPRADRSHTLRIHMDAEPRHLNPMLAPSVWTRRIAMGTIFETLVRYAPPEPGAAPGAPGRYLPGLAKSWRVDGDGLTIYVELQPGVTFHDGWPMTTADVQFSLDTARDPHKGADHLLPLLADVKSVNRVGPRMVQIVLTRPNGYILRALAEVPILPYHIYDPNLVAGGKLIGTGPWTFTSWKDGVVHLSRFPKYWAKAPAIADLEFVYQSDAGRALAAAKHGDLDVIPSLIPEHLHQADAPGIAHEFTALSLAPPRFRYLALDTAEPPFDDVRVRRALAMLVDRDGLCTNGLAGLARPIAGPVWRGGPVDGPPPEPPAHRPAAAGQLLDQAGWTDADKDGVREKGAAKLKVTFLTAEREPAQTGAKLERERQDMIDLIRRAGFLVDVKVLPADQIAKRLAQGKFGMALLEWDGMVDSDLSRWLETNRGENVGHFSSHRVDLIFAELRGDWTPAARAPHASELALALLDEEPIIGLAAPAPRGLVHRRVQGLVPWDGWFDLSALSLDPHD